MHKELMALTIVLKHSTSSKGKVYTEIIQDMIVAPSYVVRAFAAFIADREDDDTVFIKGYPVKFEDCKVTVGDSKKVVSAYKCLKGYEMPLSNYNIFSDIIKQSTTAAWMIDVNFKLFETWYVNRLDEDEDDM